MWYRNTHFWEPTAERHRTWRKGVHLLIYIQHACLAMTHYELPTYFGVRVLTFHTIFFILKTNISRVCFYNYNMLDGYIAVCSIFIIRRGIWYLEDIQRLIFINLFLKKGSFLLILHGTFILCGIHVDKRSTLLS